MLYVSTRNTRETYTAYRVLHETYAPDGGQFAPFYLPKFTDADLQRMRRQNCSETIAEILNLFFGCRLSGWDIECLIGRTPIKLLTMHHKLTVAEVWRNPDSSYLYLLKSLNGLLLGKDAIVKMPSGWTKIAIEIALIFGVYYALDKSNTAYDIAISDDDFSEFTSVIYAKAMGMPIHFIVHTSAENGAIWDLLNRGELLTTTLNLKSDSVNYFETLVYKIFGPDQVLSFVNACNKNGAFRIDDEQKAYLNDIFFSAVVSTDRINSVISSFYRMNQYEASSDLALSFSGLQDFRSVSGVSRDTLIIARKRPSRIRE